MSTHETVRETQRIELEQIAGGVFSGYLGANHMGLALLMC